MFGKPTLLVALIWLCTAPAVWSVTYYVTTLGINANAGTSWASACLTVQGAIDKTSPGDEVWVQAGTYTGQVALKTGVAVYGGFAGSETLRTQRNPTANVTILQYTLGSVITAAPGTLSTAIIDGFTITKGTGTSSLGGGIYCAGTASPTIINNVITANTAKNGAGIYCGVGSTPVISGNTISNNSANQYQSWGGGIYCDQSCAATITGNTLTGNAASYYGYGGGIACNAAKPTIANNAFKENTVTYGGGGVYCNGDAAGVSATINNNTFIGNTAQYGGGIQTTNATTAIYNNVFSQNAASGSSAFDGATQARGTFVNNTIVGNSDGTSSDPQRAVMCWDQSTVLIANNLIAFNSGGIYKHATSTSTIRNNCVYGNTFGNYTNFADQTGINGNISVDPLLAGMANGNYHIQSTSPCRNTGNTADANAAWLDMDGQARIQHAGVDIGADESNGTYWTVTPTVIRVKPDGSDANDGTTWALAKQTIQAAINTLAATGGGEAWVKAGTYNERPVLKPFVYLYGGFAGSEATRGARNWQVNNSIIDGQKGGTVVTIPANSGPYTAVDGFTIRNGQTTSSNSGGGIYVGALTAPVIARNTIQNNTAYNGGGIYVRQSNVRLENNKVLENTAGNWGGGIFIEYLCKPSVSNNVIARNAAMVNGGGLALYEQNVTCSAINNTIVGNSATLGGGVYNNTWTSGVLELSNNIIAFNNSGVGNERTLVLRNNDVFGNTRYQYAGVTDPTGSNGNISADPQFASVPAGNYHIQPTSPGKDTGLNELVLSGWTDIDNQARIQGTTVDMGADESAGSTWTVNPSIIRVRTDGNDANNGSTWALAKQTVQAAIKALTNGGEVWVKAGTYTGNLMLTPSVSLYGGFNGTESTRTARNWTTNVTILDGNAADAVVTIPSGFTTGSIDGFTLRNGIGYLSGTYRYGGGIFMNLFTAPTVANCTITQNSAYQGGGIYIGAQSTPTITNSVISANTSTENGGGIYFRDNAAPTISRSTIRDNQSNSYGGGIYGYTGVTRVPVWAMITGNTIRDNRANSWGGGIYLAGYSGAIVASNIIRQNYADNTGGLVAEDYTALTVVNNTFIANQARYNRSAVYCSTSGYFANNIVAFNSGGFTRTPAALRNNCVYGNTSYNYLSVNPGLGDIQVDPQLAGQMLNDLHIQSTSPCRNAGLNMYIRPGWLDIDGQARIQNTTVDIGADESNGTTWNIQPTIIRVKTDGNDANDGSSWTLAKQTIKGAIAALPNGGEVWVKAGVYFERITSTRNVYIYGGFVGTETLRSSRNWVTNETIIDGQSAGSVVTFPAYLDIYGAIDGFTIRNGIGTQNPGYSGKYGGGILVNPFASPTIAHNVIRNNTALDGGGLFIDLGAAPRIEENTITQNTSTPYHGGGIYIYHASPVVSHNTISGNAAAQYGGGIFSDASTATLVANIIQSNTATYYGGGIGNWNDASSVLSNLIRGNQSEYGGGLGLHNYCPQVKVLNNTIVSNTSPTTGGAGLYIGSGSTATVSNNIVAFNKSGIRRDGTATFNNNDVFGNTEGQYQNMTDPTGTNGNISVDPLFVNTGLGDYHLTAGSPCVNTGSTSGVPTDGIDIDGAPRLVVPTLEIGADEYMPLTYQGDAWIRNADEANYVGNDVYNTSGANQTRNQSIAAGVAAIYDVQVENDGFPPETLKVTGPAGYSNWAVRYYTESNADITAAVTGSGWFTPVLARGARIGLRIEVTALPGISLQSALTVPLLVTSSKDSGKFDTVRAVTTITRAAPPTPQSGTYTLDAHFDKGVMQSLEHTSVHDQLQLSNEQATENFIWVPNSNEATVSKVNTRTGQEVARYRTSPYSYSSPSRTTVDAYGNCWVANRQTGSAVKIGLLENDQWIDRNGNAICDTSRDINGDGDITGAEILPWGNDECVLYEVIVIPGQEGTYAPGAFPGTYANDYWNPGPRSVAVDSQNNVWIGCYTTQKFYYVSGVNGNILKLIDVSSKNHHPYGALIDGNGVVWSAGGSTGDLLWLNPSDDSFDTIMIGHYVYGLAVDNANHVYVSGWDSYKFSRVNVVTKAREYTVSADATAKGLACTADGDIWIAEYGSNRIKRRAPDGTVITTIPVGYAPSGVSIDADGKVWTVDYGDDAIYRIDPATNSVDLVKRIAGGTVHYGYSDMTGQALRSIVAVYGTWTVIFDSQCVGSAWGTISWTSSPVGSSSTAVQVRSSADRKNWSTWEDTGNGVALAKTPNGRFLQIRVKLQNFIGEAAPVLYDLTVTPKAPNAQPDIMAENWSATAAAGNDIYNTTGVGQTVSQTADAGDSNFYLVTVQNDGKQPDAFKVTTATAPAGWTTYYYDETFSTNISAQITGAGWNTGPLLPGESVSFWAVAAPASTTTGSLTQTIIAVSAQNPALSDVVKLTSTVRIIRPDMQLRTSAEATYSYDNIYGTDGVNQTKAQSALNGVKLTYVFKLQNDGSVTDSFRMTGTAGTSAYTVKYFGSGIGEITSEVTAAGRLLGPLAPGASVTGWIEVTPTTTATGGTVFNALLTAASVANPSMKDVVRASTTCTIFRQPDLKIRTASEATYTGDNVYNTTGVNQSKAATVAPSGTVQYYFHIQNDGNLTDTLKVTGTPGDATFTVQYFDDAGGDITTQMTNGTGYLPAIAKGGYKYFRAVVKAASGAVNGTAADLVITAVSSADNTRQDVVKATTTVLAP